MATELRILHTIFVTVPAFNRVEPAINSGPTSKRTTAWGLTPPFTGLQFG